MANKKYKAAGHVAWRRINQEVVVLDLNTSVYYSLNETGADMWELLAKSVPHDKVSREIAARYHEDEKRIEKDLEKLVKSLCGKKLLEPA